MQSHNPLQIQPSIWISQRGIETVRTTNSPGKDAQGLSKSKLPELNILYVILDNVLPKLWWFSSSYENPQHGTWSATLFFGQLWLSRSRIKYEIWTFALFFIWTEWPVGKVFRQWFIPLDISEQALKICSASKMLSLALTVNLLGGEGQEKDNSALQKPVKCYIIIMNRFYEPP